MDYLHFMIVAAGSSDSFTVCILSQLFALLTKMTSKPHPISVEISRSDHWASALRAQLERVNMDKFLDTLCVKASSLRNGISSKLVNSRGSKGSFNYV
jgi:hypothetical protein